MTDKEQLIVELENYEPYALVFSNLTISSDIVLKALAFLRNESPEEVKQDED